MENINILVRNRLKTINETHKKIQYHIVNKDGKVYSQFMGFVDYNNSIYGHLFDKNQIKVVEEVLTDNGFNDIIIKKDKIGSLFFLVVESPFGNPIGMLKLVIFTIIFIPMFIFLLNLIPIGNSEKNNINESNNPIEIIGTELLDYMKGDKE